jgi:general secretion pathway protein K
MRIPGNQRGIALVVVLWVGLLVAAIAGAFILDTRTSTQLTRNFVDNAEARALADGGVHLAVYELIRSEGEAQLSRDGRRYRRTVPGGVLDIAVEDEAGKIDINSAGRDLFLGLLRSVGTPEDKAVAIVDAIEKFRSGQEDRDDSLRSSGSRIPYISPPAGGTGAGFGGAFHSVDGLAQVPGITPALFSELRPALTIFGDDGIYYLGAPPAVLLAIPDVSREAVEKFVQDRAGEDVTAPLDDFLVQGRARDYWRENPSQFVTVKIMARSASGARFARVAIVDIRATGDTPFVIKAWREGDATIFSPSVSVGNGPSPVPEGAS